MRTPLISILVVLILAAAAAAEIPRTLSYQGLLRTAAGLPVTDGSYQLTFRLYDVSAGGAPLWSELRTVTVASGVFDVILGQVTPLGLPFDEPYWLGIQVAADPELTPRVQLTSAAYALRAAMADAADDGDWTISAGNVYRLTGRVGLGTATPQRMLHMVEQADGQLSYPLKMENPSILAGTATGLLFKVDAGGEDRGKGAIAYERTSTWNRGRMLFLQNNMGDLSRASLADAAMTITSDRNVGIGTIDPQAKLEVTSHIRSTGFSWPPSGKGLELAYNPDQNKGYVFAYDRDTQTFGNLALGSGNVGIGTSYPVELLHVTGVIYSSSGGIKFPDGTLQTTAGGGTGGGLVLPYSGSASTTGAAFTATNSAAYGDGIRGVHAASNNHGLLGTYYAGVVGYHDPSDCYGYVGANGYGVWGLGFGGGTGVYGETVTGYGVRGDGGTQGLAGVYGTIAKATAPAVHGVNTAANTVGKLGTQLAGVEGEGGSYGIKGTSFSGGVGVYGVNASARAVYGVTSTGAALEGSANGVGGVAVKAVALNGAVAGDFQGNVKIRGAGGAVIIEFGEGLDYAEGFDVSAPEQVGPGSVLVIDPGHPGKLTRSSRAYDTRVAGIVAGAEGLGSAVRLGVDRFDHDVALAGRVYCNVDAGAEGIEPGDLLTTSDLPGFAMKVRDRLRGQGAILGKAMETMPRGARGRILVLVTLQ